MKRVTKLTVLALSASTALSSTQALAEDGADNTIPEIIVTANKRAQSVNTVGTTITALSGDQLQVRKVSSLADIAALVPGLVYSKSSNNTPVYTLRGVGVNENTLSIYPAVSVYIDEVPLAFPALTAHSAFDLERIEVLKGPQGTLFGQNSTGGAINYIAAKPTRDFSAGADISYGRFNQVDANFHISGPIAPGLTARIAATASRSDDWQYSTSRNDRIGQQKYAAGRFLLNYDNGNGMRFQFNLNGWVDKGDPQAAQVVGRVVRFLPSVTQPVLDQPLSPLDPRAADWSTGAFRPRADRRMWQGSLRTDLDVSDKVLLTSITSYTHYKQTQTTDQDGSTIHEFDLAANDGLLKSFAQEVRLASSGKSALQWVIGANYEASTGVEHQEFHFGSDSSASRPELFFANRIGTDTTNKMRNYAFFGNAEYSLDDRFTVKGGVRYTNARRTVNSCSYDLGDGATAALTEALAFILSGGRQVVTVNPGDCITLDKNLLPGSTFVDTLPENNVSWKVGVDFKANSDTLLYANVSKGYKAGSYATLVAATVDALTPVVQESLLSYEAGFKTKAFDNRLQLNGAAFYYDYRNKQVRGKKTFFPLGNLDAFINVPKSRVIGVELDGSFRPVDGLTIGGSVTYLDSKVQKYTFSDLNGNTTNYAGDPIPYTPKWSGTVDAEYRMKLGNGGTTFVGASALLMSSLDGAFGGSRIQREVGPGNAGPLYPYHIDGYTTVDLRAGYISPDDKWRVSVFGKNVFNKFYTISLIGASDFISRLTGAPATYGVTFGYSF